MEAQPLLNTIANVCDRTNLPKCSIYRALNSGKLKGVKHGNRTLIRESDLQSFIDQMPDFIPNPKTE